jgi:hypothetical protein
MTGFQRACVVLALAVAATNTAVAAPPDENDAAIVAIDAAIQSLTQQPSQNMQLSCTAVRNTVNGPGTGISITATGGGVGSTTTGMIVSMSGAQCSAAVGEASGALSQQAVQKLSDLKASLEASPAEKSTIMSRLAELGKTYIAQHRTCFPSGPKRSGGHRWTARRPQPPRLCTHAGIGEIHLRLPRR